MGSMSSSAKRIPGKFPWAATPTTQPPRGGGPKRSGGPKRKGKARSADPGVRKTARSSRGHQLDPGTKHRSGGYIASSPSGPGATNPRGKKLEYKQQARQRKAQQAASVYNSAFFQGASSSLAANAKRAKIKAGYRRHKKSWLGGK